MPYTIKEVKGKNKLVSVVNKDTGKVMSKGTTESKANKQIKAIYANMKPEHRIRHRIGMMDGLGIHNPVHRGVINEVKKLLKHEEIHGNGFWDFLGPLNFLDEKRYPVLNLFLKGAPESHFVENAIKDYGMTALTVLAEPWLAPFAVADALANKKEDAVPTQQSRPQTIPDEEEIDEEEEEEFEEEIEEEEEEEFEEEIEEEEEVMKKVAKEEIQKENVAESLDKLVEHIQKETQTLDEPLRFPMIYNYDENNKPMNLQAWLLSNGVSGKQFSINEFGNTYKNQQPYKFLNFPINGGKLGKINYSKLGYSKY